jgi:hypothetical protein
MATSQQFLVSDNSTLANFKQWAQAISTFFATAGWLQSADTGQVNWGTIAAVPGTNLFVYEVWQPNDGLTNFYVLVEYGNSGISGTNSPGIRITVSTTTNGAGTPTGLIMGPWKLNPSAAAPLSTTTQYECDFSGAAGRIGIMMWRTITNNGGQAFGIERSVNSSGTYTSSHVTLVGCGQASQSPAFQQSLVFGVGAYQFATDAVRDQNPGAGLYVRYFTGSSSGPTTSAFNGSIPFDTIAPLIGYFDYPLTIFGVAGGVDIAEGVTFTATLYGATRTYMPSKNAPFSGCAPWARNGAWSAALCMRYD